MTSNGDGYVADDVRTSPVDRELLGTTVRIITVGGYQPRNAIAVSMYVHSDYEMRIEVRHPAHRLQHWMVSYCMWEASSGHGF
jgi:hypothetical protein